GVPQLVLVPAGNDDVGAGLDQPASHRLSQALASPRYQSYFSAQVKQLLQHGIDPRHFNIVVRIRKTGWPERQLSPVIALTAIEADAMVPRPILEANPAPWQGNPFMRHGQTLL